MTPKQEARFDELFFEAILEMKRQGFVGTAEQANKIATLAAATLLAYEDPTAGAEEPNEK